MHKCPHRFLSPARRLAYRMVFCSTVAIGLGHWATPWERLWGQELQQRSAWSPPDEATLQKWLQATREALSHNGATESVSSPDDLPVTPAVPSTDLASQHDRLQDFCRQLAEIDPRFRTVFDICQQPPTFPVSPPAILQSSEAPVYAIANLQLLYGRWLAAAMLHDEALEMLQALSPDQVVDPATLLFYRAAALHHLGRSDEALANLALLRSNPEAVPQRFSTVAQLMEADLKATSRHQLDPVARLMDRIQTRLGHARAGKRVRTEEQEVIDQLDKMIDELEKQLKAAQAAAQQQQQQQAGGNSAPGQPAQDSYQAGPQGVGDVTPREFADKSDWGNLPPKERERALQQLSKDFPSHYRDIVERYFRRLAQEPSSSP